MLFKLMEEVMMHFKARTREERRIMSCDRAIVRMRNTLRGRADFALRDERSDLQSRRWDGVAMLLVGQVRGGTLPTPRDSLARLLRASNVSHIFALLEYTTGGFTFRFHGARRQRARDVPNATVDTYLRSLGVPYTLREFRREEEDAGPLLQCPRCAPECAHRHFPFHQWFKVDMAFQMMLTHEVARGRPYRFVIKARPDIVYSPGALARTTTVPTVCTSIGGGGGDVLVAGDRASFISVVNVWRMREDCPLTIDACPSRHPLLTECARHMSEERCDHAVASTALRFGVRPVHCSVGGSFASPVRIKALL